MRVEDGGPSPSYHSETKVKSQQAQPEMEPLQCASGSATVPDESHKDNCGCTPLAQPEFPAEGQFENAN